MSGFVQGCDESFASVTVSSLRGIFGQNLVEVDEHFLGLVRLDQLLRLGFPKFGFIWIQFRAMFQVEFAEFAVAIGGADVGFFPVVVGKLAE